jgi:hypothetical protein
MSVYGAYLTGTGPADGNGWNIKSFGANSINLYEGKSSFGSSTNPVSKVSILAAPTATANYGTLSIGSGPFDGATAGFFTGLAAGTHIAINAASGSTSDFANWQVAGVQRFGVTAAGAMTLATSAVIPTLYGSVAANGDITIEGTSHATKTSSYIILQPTGGRVGVGVAAPTAALDVSGSIVLSGTVSVGANQVLGSRKTGWTVPTGTATRTGFNTATATLTQLAEHLKALIDDLHNTAGHGAIGT